MTDAELAGLDATHALNLLRAGTLGAVEYAEALLRRVDAAAALNAMTHVDPGAVRSAARRADQVPRADRGLLHGLPLIVKDNIDAAGLPCTAASPALKGHVPRRDADCVAPLRAAGVIVLGKANMHELALGVTSANAAYGTVGNPRAPGRIAGGSSGGTAAAIVAGLAPAGLGTDTGGSIRIPAAHCGAVGFRPSTGRWPTRGVVPISVPSRDTAAPLARSVADCALLDAVVCGVEPVLEVIDLRTLRLGIPQEFWHDLHVGLADQLAVVLDSLRRAGITLVPLALGVDLEAVGDTGLAVAMAENLPALRAYFADHGLAFDPTQLAATIASPNVKAIIEHLVTAGAPDAAAYAAARATIQDHLQPAWERAWSQHGVDALLAPTTPLPAPRIGEDETALIDGRKWPVFASHVRHCGPASIVGLPSLSLPAGTTAVDGLALPVGLMLDGPRGSDRRLLAIGSALQSLLPALPPVP
ncbi:MAG: amidase family protein [Burkholderiaceae bacterium]|jgi:mandelamide amidase|nr:amidase family protein [Burkholderiaceae bacterium]